MVVTNLDLDALRSFVAGIDLGSFAQAAERLNRSPSALSLQLRKLETQIGLPLTRKSGRGLALTEAGETLLGPARRLLALNDETLAALREPALAGRVRLGLPQDFAETWLPGARLLLEMKSDMGRYRSNELQHILSDTPEEGSRYEKRMSEIWTKMHADLATYQKLPADPSDIQLAQDLKAAMDAYAPLHDKVIAASAAERNDEAKALSRGDALKVYVQMSNALDALVKINLAGGNQASSDASALYASARAWDLRPDRRRDDRLCLFRNAGLCAQPGRRPRRSRRLHGDDCAGHDRGRRAGPRAGYRRRRAGNATDGRTDRADQRHQPRHHALRPRPAHPPPRQL
jgi:hypothetical protein